MLRGTSFLLLASMALPSTMAVSLQAWTPRADGLPPACQAVYTADIPVCQPSDFENNKCSTGCINALNNLVPTIAKACRGLTGSSLLVVFMDGQGAQTLCPNYRPTTSTGPDSTAASPTPQTQTTASDQPQTSTAAPPTDPASASPTASSSSEDAPSATPSATDPSTDSGTTVAFSTATVVPQPSSSLATVIATDTGAPSATAPKSSSTSASATAKINQQGSPFDTGMSGSTKSNDAVRPSSGLLPIAAALALPIIAAAL